MTDPTLTPEDIKNGWTPEALKAYLAERGEAALGDVRAGGVDQDLDRAESFEDPAPRVETANDKDLLDF